MDKNKAVIDFLLTCPAIRDNPLFFNFAQATADNSQFSTRATDVEVNVPFIDGAVKKRYTFTLIFYKMVAHRAIIENADDENMEYAFDIQSVIEWVTAQNKAENYPDFGDKCHIEELVALTDQPILNRVDNSSTPALAKYSISIKIEYIDTSEVIWNVKGD